MQRLRLTFVLVSFLFIGLLIADVMLLKQSPELIPLFLRHLLPILHGTFIIGFGIGLPLILISALFGWGQVVLLLNKQISPHLVKSNWLNALYIFLGKP